MKTKTAAVITINRPGSMTAKGAKDIAAWMRRQARFLEKHAKDMAPTFRARYLHD